MKEANTADVIEEVSAEDTANSSDEKTSLWSRVKSMRNAAKYSSPDDNNSNEQQSIRKKKTLVIKQNYKRGDSQPVDDCLICHLSLVAMSPQERARHTNNCLDSKASEEYIKGNPSLFEEEERLLCPICGKDLTYHSEGRRQQHYDECCVKHCAKSSDEETEKPKRPTKKKASTKRKRVQEEVEDNPMEFICVICKKDLSTESSQAQTRHLKACAKLNNVNLAEIKQLQTKQKKRKTPPKKAEEDNEQSDLNRSNMFEAFKYGSDSRLRGKMSETTSEEFVTVADWLKTINMAQYTDAFMKNGYDNLEICSRIEMNDLTESVGIKKAGHNKQILLAAKDLKKTIVYRRQMQKLDERKKAKEQTEKSVANSERPSLLQTENRASMSQIAEFVMNDFSNEVDSQDIVPATQPLLSSRFVSRSSKSASGLWGMAKAVSIVDLEVSEPKVDEKEDKTCNNIIQDESASMVPSPNQNVVKTEAMEETPRSKPTSFQSPFVIEDSPFVAPVERNIFKSPGEPLNQPRASIDSLLELELLPRKHVPSSQKPPDLSAPLSPVLLDSDGDSDVEIHQASDRIEPALEFAYSNASSYDLLDNAMHSQEQEKEQESEPPTHTQVEKQISSRNMLNMIQTTYDKRCETEISTFMERVKIMYKDVTEFIKILSQRCETDLEYESRKSDMEFEFKKFQIPALKEVFAEKESTTAKQAKPKEKVAKVTRKKASTKRATSSPKKKTKKKSTTKSTTSTSSSATTEEFDQLSTQPESQQPTSSQNTDEDELGNLSDSEIRTVDWAQHKKDKARKNERIVRNVEKQASPNKPGAKPNQPDFAAMKNDELKAVLSKFGVKPGNRAFMIQMCSRLWNAPSGQ